MLIPPICESCKYYHETTDTCEAFLDKIPLDRMRIKDDKKACKGEYYYEMRPETALRKPEANAGGYLSRLIDIL